MYEKIDKTFWLNVGKIDKLHILKKKLQKTVDEHGLKNLKSGEG